MDMPSLGAGFGSVNVARRMWKGTTVLYRTVRYGAAVFIDGDKQWMWRSSNKSGYGGGTA